MIMAVDRSIYTHAAHYYAW